MSTHSKGVYALGAEENAGFDEEEEVWEREAVSFASESESET